MPMTTSEKAALEALNDAQLRAIVRENDRKRNGGVPVPPAEQAEADHAVFTLGQRAAAKA